MTHLDIIMEYFERFFSGTSHPEDIRHYLADDFTFTGPLMNAESADDYILQLKAMGDELEMYAEVRSLLGSDDVVAALVDFQGPGGTITYAQWFTLREGKISSLEVVYDPRSFFASD